MDMVVLQVSLTLVLFVPTRIDDMVCIRDFTHDLLKGQQIGVLPRLVITAGNGYKACEYGNGACLPNHHQRIQQLLPISVWR